MSAVGRFLRRASDGDYLFWCPGCKCTHRVDSRWTLSGSSEAPTVKPSVKVTGCHLRMKAGQLQFLKGSKHDLAGQTVPMEPL